MLAKKLLWTGVLVLSYVLIATAGDFTLNVLILQDPAGFTPLGTVMLTILVGAPTTYYLTSQQMDLRRATEQRDQTDVDLRRKSEELAASEARYRLLADESPDVIIRYDPTGQVEYLSPAARKYGWDPDNPGGAHVANALDPRDLKRHQKFLRDLANGRPILHGEESVWRAVAATGEAVCFEARSSPIHNAEGTFLGAVVVLRDVTERRRAAAALQQNEQKLRGLFQLAPVGIALTDTVGRCFEFNEAFREISGYSEEELRALDYRTLTPPEYAEAEAAKRASLEQTGRYGPYEKEYVRKDGSRVPVRVNSMLIESPDGEKFIWSIVENIAERRRAEAVLIEARNAAEAATVAKSEFLANMSHEIRTPLTGILGFTGLLEDLPDLPPAAGTYVARIVTCGQTLLSVVNDILDFSKLDADKIELDPHPFDPALVVADSIGLVGAEAARKGLYIRNEILGVMPEAVFADSSRIRQVLLNLLSNAIKFTDHGGVTVRSAYSAENGGRLRISVADSGIGIPPDRQGNLFQRFSQVDGSISRQYGGTGLGLAISKRLTELMGGEVHVESQEGAGSTFSFTVNAPPTAAEQTHTPDQSFERCQGRARILVVDDLPVNRELVRAILSVFNAEITEAGSGAEAVAAAMAHGFDVILMDLQMPGMDGLAAARAIRQGCELNQRTPILALSANVLPEHRAACSDAGMDDHIAKPISPMELLGKIAAWTASDERGEGLDEAAA